jgi:hypothetical protein
LRRSIRNSLTAGRDMPKIRSTGRKCEASFTPLACRTWAAPSHLTLGNFASFEQGGHSKFQRERARPRWPRLPGMGDRHRPFHSGILGAECSSCARATPDRRHRGGVRNKKRYMVDPLIQKTQATAEVGVPARAWQLVARRLEQAQELHRSARTPEQLAAVGAACVEALFILVQIAYSSEFRRLAHYSSRPLRLQ